MIKNIIFWIFIMGLVVLIVKELPAAIDYEIERNRNQSDQTGENQ